MKQRTRDALFYVTAIVCCLLTVLLMANAFVKVDQNVAANASANDLPVILLDAGHGGEDGGAGENGVQEKDVNLAVALQLREFLEMSGFRVVMTRETDVSIHDDSASTIREKKVSDLHNRLKLIEQYPGCTFISIHQNQFEQSQYHGAQMFYSKNDESCSKALCLFCSRTMSARSRRLPRTSTCCGTPRSLPSLWNAAFFPTRRKRPS